MYKVFVFDKLIILSGQPVEDSKLQSFKQIPVSSRKSVRDEWNAFINNPSEKKLILYNNQNAETLLDQFISLFWYVEAAGGMVYNTKDERLFIHRFGKWDLPKGKIERNESRPDAAVREVREETGLQEVEITGELPSTFHVFDHKGKKVLKRTYWYKMLYTGTDEPKPQTEEEIIEAVWFKNEDIGNIRMNTYSSLISLLEE